ncbi:MAG: hypothetical protein JST66_02185 [Bacteroidetes bacterium]|nr:hypothetical protein [Bacteroidota bacterium]
MNVRAVPLFAFALAVLASSCKKDEKGGVPLTGVNININVNLPEYNDLAVPGGWVYLTGGSQGLIVYRKSTDEFVAVDRHCPYRPEDVCKVVVDESEVIARDTACCHSAFLLLDGSVTEGPAALGLKRYNTTFNGTTLHIFN